MEFKSVDVLSRIKEEKTFYQIMVEENISYKRLLVEIKNLIKQGYKFDKYFFSDGSTILTPKDNNIEENPLITEIIFNSNSNQFRGLFFGDTHTGHVNDSYDSINRAYDFAINNKIHYIFILGDIVENTYTNEKLRLTTIDKQIDFVTREIPCDRRITTFVLYGNHDYYSLQKYGLDIAKIIEDERSDLINLGYGRHYIKINEDYFCLEHECHDSLNSSELRNKSAMTFLGHSHLYKFNNETKKKIYVPALSDVTPSNYSKQDDPVKGFLDVEFLFTEGGFFNKINMKHYIEHYGVNYASKVSFNVRRKK